VVSNNDDLKIILNFNQSESCAELLSVQFVVYLLTVDSKLCRATRAHIPLLFQFISKFCELLCNKSLDIKSVFNTKLWYSVHTNGFHHLELIRCFIYLVTL